MAQREIGLSVGEPPTTKGYTPSVFALLPKLLERAGMGRRGMGSITGLYTVLVDGDDMTEPIADATRAILDGHVVLSRSLAEQGHYPAIDVLASKSRLMTEIAERKHLDAAQAIVSLIATYAKAETLINIGAYAHGSNPAIDRAIQMHDPIEAYLCQGLQESSTLDESIRELLELERRAAGLNLKPTPPAGGQPGARDAQRPGETR
jgi:flagellum-specific ATP synthase